MSTRQQNNITKKEEKQMLSSKIINSLPVVRSVWGFGISQYANAREMALLKSSFEIAETLAQPLVDRYKSIDHFASNQVDKVSTAYDTVASVGVVQAAVYPVGYAYGLTLGTMNALESNIEGTRLEKPIIKLYDFAGAIIDGIMPAPADEKVEGDRNSLRAKNPVRRIGRRASMQSVRSLPRNSINFAIQTTKKYSRMASYKSLDWGLVFMWNRATGSYRMAERVATFLFQYSFIRSLAERPIPLLYHLSESFAWSQRVRHEGGAVLMFTINALLTQLDFLYTLSKTSLPRTSETIEKLSLTLYNLQEFLEHAKKRRLSVYDDDDEQRLQKRSKLGRSSQNAMIMERATAILAPIIEKVQEITENVENVQMKSSSEVQTPVVNVRDAKTAAINPFAALTEMTTDEVPTNAHHAHHAHKTHTTDAPKEESTTQQDEDFAARIAERAEHEMQMWKQRELEQKEERERHLRERHVREKQMHEEEERRAREAEKQARVDAVNKRIAERAAEKVRLEEEAQLAQDKADNERLEKELAHMRAHEKYTEEKAARDAVLAEKHRAEEYERKRAEVTRIVAAALAERERQWREEHADEIRAKEIGDQLVAQEEEEKKAQEEEVRAHEAEVQEEEHNKKTDVVAEEKEEVSVGAPTPTEEQEVVVVKGHKIADEVTNWSVQTEDEGAWETVTPKHATHLKAEPILHPKPVVDASVEKNNEFLALTNAQGNTPAM